MRKAGTSPHKPNVETTSPIENRSNPKLPPSAHITRTQRLPRRSLQGGHGAQRIDAAQSSKDFGLSSESGSRVDRRDHNHASKEEERRMRVSPLLGRTNRPTFFPVSSYPPRTNQVQDLATNSRLQSEPVGEREPKGGGQTLYLTGKKRTITVARRRHTSQEVEVDDQNHPQ